MIITEEYVSRRLLAISTHLGAALGTDNTIPNAPSYGGTRHFISEGDALSVAIAKLDSALKGVQDAASGVITLYESPQSVRAYNSADDTFNLSVPSLTGVPLSATHLIVQTYLYHWHNFSTFYSDTFTRLLANGQEIARAGPNNLFPGYQGQDPNYLASTNSTSFVPIGDGSILFNKQSRWQGAPHADQNVAWNNSGGNIEIVGFIKGGIIPS